MNTDKPKYIVLDARESFLGSVARDAVTFGFLALCIWISQGSTWWTFFTACLFLLWGATKAKAVTDERRHQFHNIDDLKAWVDREQVSDTQPR